MDDLIGNKQQIRRFFDIANENGFDTAIATLAEDCRWWTTEAEFTKPDIAALVGQLGAHLSEPFRFETGHITAEEDRVAVEARSHALRKSGIRYANHYHFLFRLRDGAIIEVHEHSDTAHAAVVWSDLAG